MLSLPASVAILAAEYVLVLAIAPLLLGLLAKIRALSQGRRGPPLIQPYRYLRKLFAKESIYSETSSWLTRWAPVVSFAALMAAIPLVPWVVVPSPVGAEGDLIVLVGFLALSRFFTAAAALDAGSTFGGMGSTREMWMGAISEPVFLLVIFAFAAPAGSTEAGMIAARGVSLGLAYVSPPLLLAIVAFLMLLIVETGRLPADNPSTHLELTMVHEAMVLEYTGPDLALFEWGQGVKLVLMLGVLAALAAPWGLSTSGAGVLVALAVGLAIAKLLLATAAIGRFEARMAKWRLFRVSDLLTFAAVLAFGSLALLYVVGGGA